MLDWDAFRESLLTALLEAASKAGGPWRAVALAHLYAETDGIINAPLLYLNSDGAIMHSPADWEIAIDDWAPEPWIEALTAEACSGTVPHWDDVFARYQDVLAQICVAAGARLGVPVFYIEYSRYEEMLARCLTPSQLASLFPEVVASQAERARVAGLPTGGQIAYYISRLDGSGGPIGWEEAEEALCGFGADAIPALLALLRDEADAWQAASLLGQIGIADDTVTAALSAAIAAFPPDTPAQLWSCRALAHLGRLDLVLARASDLSAEAVATAVAARYRAFRDRGTHPLPLDYRPLEDFLAADPEIAASVADELAPGNSYCVISSAEVQEALRGTGSEHLVVRKHAVCVLGERRLGEAIGQTVIPRLRAIAQTDPDSEVRRLAALSLEWWKADR